MAIGGGLATLVGVLVGLQSLGWALPWTAETRDHAAATFETREHAEEQYEMFEEKHEAVLRDIQAELHQLNEKLP